MKVLIAGGSGMLGKEITRRLVEDGHTVGWLTRKSRPSENVTVQFLWNPDHHEIDPEAMEWAEAVINLAGESIGEIPWTTEGRKRILESRIQSVQLLAEAIQKRKEPLLGFVGVSGAGYYGPSTNPKSEEDKPGIDFPARVAKAWEDEYLKIKESNPRHFALLRLGVVLSNTGGAFPKIVQPVRFGIGAALGTGLQNFNWIHLSDAARIFVQALEWDGIYNASAPKAINNREATKIIASQLKMPLWLPAVPAFLLRLALGERANLVLEGNVSDVWKLLGTGFEFQFPEFRKAVADLLS